MMIMTKKKKMKMKMKSNSTNYSTGGGSSSSVTCFDDEYMVVEILSRLPVKSLLRFKCISKRWCSLIQDPYFVDLHYTRSITRPGATFFISGEQTKAINYDGQIILFGSTNYDGPHFYSIDYVSFIGDHACRTSRFGPHYYRTTYDKLTYTQILNGLLFMSFKEETVWIMNPSIRKTILLTKTNFIEEEEEASSINNKDNWMNNEYYIVIKPSYGFGFDPITKKYKVICICRIEIHYVPPQYFLYNPLQDTEHEFDPQHLTTYYRCKVLTIEDDDDCCWRRIDIPPICVSGDPVYINGALYWKDGSFERYWYNEVIVRFDISTEKFNIIKTPWIAYYKNPAWPDDWVGGKHYNYEKQLYEVDGYNLTSLLAEGQQHQHCQHYNVEKQLYEVDGYLALLDNENTTDPNTIVIWKLLAVPEAAAADADAAARCWVKETILTLSFDWRHLGYGFEIIGKNQILLKRVMYYSHPNCRNVIFLCYYDRDNNDIYHGKKKTSTCDDGNDDASFIPSFHTWIKKAVFKYYPTSIHSCIESLWSRS